MKRILVVDESELARDIVTAMLEARGYDVVGIGSLRDVAEAVAREEPDLVLFDLAHPSLRDDARAALAGNVGAKPCPVILFTEGPPAELARNASMCGAEGYIKKSDAPATIARHIERLLETRPA